jgi:4-amino-4-deoxy-L-arabinose transferase-like glycosyltransferase
LKTLFKVSPLLPFYLLVIGIFLIIASPTLFSDGMFMDGLIYSTTAHNLSNGLGTFWNPYFSATSMTDFHEHPPLAIGLQSLFFTLFGESRIIDKLYSIMTFVFVGYIIVKIWSILNYKHAWIPLLFWLITPLVLWAISNNMLENTLSIFTSLSVLFYLKSQNNHRFTYIFLSGLMLALGFLTKGFVAFFPWTLPFLIWLLLRQHSFRSIVVDSLGVFLFTVIPLLLLVLAVPEAKLSLLKYIDVQVINSLKNTTTVETRFYIIERLFSELIPALILFLLFVAFAWRKKIPLNVLKTNAKTATVFLLLGLTGVLPIMVSMKQNGFYILTSLPFFALGIGIFLIPLVEYLFKNFNYKSKGYLVFGWTASVFLIVGISLSVFFSSQIGRDENMIKDTYKVLSVLPKGSIINIHPTMSQYWSLHGYFSRYKNVSLDPNSSNKRDFLLIHKNVYSDTLTINYSPVELQTVDYLLFERTK